MLYATNELDIKHYQSVHRSVYIGLLSPGDDPGRYVQSIEYLYEAYQQLDDQPPLVINTMGWNKGDYRLLIF